MQNPESLIKEIKIAFSEIPYPGDHHLVMSSFDDEPETIRRHFVGKDKWQSLTPDELDIDAALAFFSDAAFRFYLPAFMIADLKEQIGLNDPSIRLCWTLSAEVEHKKVGQGEETMGARAKKTFARFNKQQVRVIVNYLKWKYEQTNDRYIREALDKYWLRRS